MARKMEYTREMILEAAIKLYKEKDFSVITAKNIAKELGCSTTPIYSVYLSLDDIKNDVILHIGESVLLEEERLDPKKDRELFLGKMLKKMGINEKDPEVSLKIEDLRIKLLSSDNEINKLDLFKEIAELTTFLFKEKKVKLKKSEVLKIMAKHRKYFTYLLKKRRNKE